MTESKRRALLFALLLIAVIQLLRIGLMQLASLAYPPSSFFGKKMLTMCVMLLLTPLFVLFARKRGVSLSVFPQRFTKPYIAATAVAAALLITAPSNYIVGFTAIMELFYGSIVTPVFEELIFRGYLWNSLGATFSSERAAYAATTALFTLWHLGYMLESIVGGNWTAVLWKLAAGLCYGAVLGFARLKTKNCYSTMLLHGILNLFMI